MTFEESLDQAIAMLQRCGRVTYRALKQQCQLDDATLEDLKHELIEGQRLAVDEQGDVLVWTGGVPLHPVPVPAPSPPMPSSAPLGARPAPSNVPSVAPLPADAERRQLTVLFCDLVGSTLLAEQLDPEDLREVVRAYQQASAAIIVRYNGYIAQYQGDGLLVYFGFPQAHEDDAQRAGHTALGIVAMLDDLNGQLEQIHGVRIAVRIGIHTGPVVVGTLGDETRQELLALGETPAIAAGIQGLAPPDSVVVSAATAHLLQDVFVYEALGTHLVNDVADPIAVLHVLASRTAELSPATVVPPERADEVDEAERRQLTVMFCTLADPARLAIQLTSAHLLTVVQGYQQACAAVVQYYDGYIAQYLENGVLVYFGFPHAHEDDAQRAVRTGLEIVDAMPALNAHLTPQYGVRVATRIGIHTGRVVAGTVGGGTRTEQLAVGPTPNVAARIHGLATPDTVMISATTLRLVHGYFVCEDRGTHLLKGVADPMPVARVLTPTTAQSRLEAVGTGEGSALVGRDMELAVCVDRWVQSTAGQGQVVVLWGEAAIGKSRLVEALYTHIHWEEGRRITFRCLPYHTHSAFYPLITHLERRLQFTRDEPVEAKIVKLEQWLKTYRFPLPETLPLIAALLSVPLPEGHSPPLQLGLQQQRQRTQATLVAWLMEEAERQPLLAVWEDLHWMDPSTLEVLGLLIDHTATGRMLTVLTARPEFQPPWEPRGSLTVLTLRRLERGHVEAIVQGVTRGKALPAAILAQIVEKTDGVPLFVEELTKAIVESGMVRAVNGHYELTALAGTIEIPLTLQDSLMARLDRLGAAKRVAQVGAVIGREFSPELLEAVTPHDMGAVQRLVDQLVAAELLFPHESPQATYVFKHALIRDAAYQSLLRRTRQQYHQRIAQVLSERFPETMETQPEVLAHHFTEAGLRAQALSYWQRAGERATQRSAHMEAVNHLTKGLEILRTLPHTPEHTQQELMLQVALGAPLMATKGWAAPEVEQVCGRARELCQQAGESVQLFPVLWGLWNFYIVRAQVQTAQELGEQFLRLAQNTPDPAFLLQAHFIVGDTFFWCGEFPPARAHLEQDIALDNPQRRCSHAALYGLDPGIACLSHAAWTLWVLGYPEQALKRAYQALTVAKELSHPLSVAWALWCAGVLHRYRQERQAAQEQAEALITLATEQEFPHWVVLGTLLRGWAVTEQGQRKEEIEPMRQSIATWQAMGAELDRPHCLALLAEAWGTTGQPEEGLVVLDEALAAVHRTGEHYCEANLYWLVGELSLQLLRPQSTASDPRPRLPNPQAEAEACFHQAIAIARRQSAKSFELRASMSLARLWQQEGKRAEAYELLAPIYGWFTEGFDTADLQEAKALLDALA